MYAFYRGKHRPRGAAYSTFVLCFLLVALLSPVPLSCCLYVCLLAADAALKEEHVIDGRTIDVKRAVPRDRAPLPRLVRVMRVDFSDVPGWVGDLAQKPGVTSTAIRIVIPTSLFALFSI